MGQSTRWGDVLQVLVVNELFSQAIVSVLQSLVFIEQSLALITQVPVLPQELLRVKRYWRAKWLLALGL